MFSVASPEIQISIDSSVSSLSAFPSITHVGRGGQASLEPTSDQLSIYRTNNRKQLTRSICYACLVPAVLLEQSHIGCAGAFASPLGQYLENSSLHSHHGPLKPPKKRGATQVLAETFVTFPCRSTNFLELGACYDPRESLEQSVTLRMGCASSCWDLQDKQIPVGVEGKVVCLSEVKQASGGSWSYYANTSSSLCACGLPWTGHCWGPYKS